MSLSTATGGERAGTTAVTNHCKPSDTCVQGGMWLHFSILQVAPNNLEGVAVAEAPEGEQGAAGDILVLTGRGRQMGLKDMCGGALACAVFGAAIAANNSAGTACLAYPTGLSTQQFSSGGGGLC
jgi:hypothetical protein